MVVELIHVDWNPKPNPEPTFYSCVKKKRSDPWICRKGLSYTVIPKNYEVIVTSVPDAVPSILHKPYLTLSLSSSVQILKSE